MKTYPNVMAHFYNRPLALSEAKALEIDDFLRSKLDLSSLPKKKDRPQPKLAVSGPVAKGRGGVAMVGRVALLPLFGVIGQRMNLMMDISGGTSTEQFGVEFDDLVADKAVRAVLIVCDSPGGGVSGVAELFEKIYAARDQKRVVAIADSCMGSAAYWICSAASELIVTTGGEVGSVGVIAAHTDMSKADEMEGIKTTFVSAGKYKAEGRGEPLTPETKDYLQQQVDQYYAMFTSAVARGRNTTPANVRSEAYGQGRMKLAADAKASGMVDRVATLQATVNRLENITGGSSGKASTAAAARARAVEVEAAADPPNRNAQQAAARARAVEVETEADGSAAGLSADDDLVRDARAAVERRRAIAGGR